MAPRVITFQGMRQSILIATLGVVSLASGLVPGAEAFERLRTREVLAIERGLGDARRSLRSAPAEARRELDRAERTLRRARLDSRSAGGDGRGDAFDILRFERSIRALRADVGRAERTARRRARIEVREEAAPGFEPPFPRSFETDLRGSERPIGTAKLFIFIQNGLRDAGRALARGDRSQAARLMSQAEENLANLAAAHPGDPHVVASTAELARLRAELTGDRS